MASEAHYFIAIPLSTALQNDFSVWQRELKRKLTYKNWPDYRDLHITLKFLGPVADNKREQLKEALLQIEGLQKFSIEVGSIGTFGKSDQPRVLWAGVSKTKALSAIQQKVEALLVNIGFQAESREFHPHITLAKKWLGNPAADVLKEIKKQFTEIQQLHVDEIVLYQIHPTKTIKYEVVQTYKLQGGE